MLDGSSLLITGGTGSFGRSLLSNILNKQPKIGRIIIYSRDEQKQFELQNLYSSSEYPQLRFFIGDVRDRDRLVRALEGVDYVIHAAALKQVPAAEYNPFECIKTNVLGAQNVIDASIQTGVKKVIAISTDKAASPTNLYGATKLCSDKLVIAANNCVGDKPSSFSVVRYGNVLGSRGSIIPHFLNTARQGYFPVTDVRMTRFGITLFEEVDFVLDALEKMWGGEIFVKKCPSFRVLDIAEAIDPKIKIKLIGLRPGEKLYESMITEHDSHQTLEFSDYFVIYSSHFFRKWDVEDYIQKFSGKKCLEGFHYSSDTNESRFSVKDLEIFIQKFSEDKKHLNH